MNSSGCTSTRDRNVNHCLRSTTLASLASIAQKVWAPPRRRVSSAGGAMSNVVIAVLPSGQRQEDALQARAQGGDVQQVGAVRGADVDQLPQQAFGPGGDDADLRPRDRHRADALAPEQGPRLA